MPIFQVSIKATRPLVVAALLLSPSFFTSCAKKVGSNMIGASHGNYNHVVSSIQQEELLLNVVRRRYLEPLQFTSLGSISQSRSVSNGVGGNISGLGGITAGGLNGNSSVEDFPSYSLTPQSGPEASKALHKKIPLEVLSDMDSAGYSVDLIFSLLAREVNGIRSVGIDAGGGLIGGSPKFKAMLFAMSHLDANDRISVGNAVWEEKLFEHAFAPEVFSPSEVVTVKEATHRFTSTDDGQSFYVTGKSEQPILWVSPDARRSGPGKELLSMLRLDPDCEKKGWVLRDREFASETELLRNSRASRNQVPIQTRSIYGVLNLMAQGVQVAPGQEAFACSSEPFLEAVKCGKAPNIPTDFVVHYSVRCPKQAFVAVKHRSGWFYIDDADCSSKKYFNALFDIYNLAGPQRINSGSSSGISGGPILTLR